MVEKGRGYARSSSMFEVDVLRSDNYMQTLKNMCEVLEIDLDEDMVLFTAAGSIIPRTSAWSLGSYLSKKRLAPEKLKLGVGFATRSGCDRSSASTSEDTRPLSSSVKRLTLRPSEDDYYESITPTYRSVCDNLLMNLSISVFYSEKSSVVPLSRSEVWAQIGGVEGGVNRGAGVFLPEVEDFIVTRVVCCQKGTGGHMIVELY